MADFDMLIRGSDGDVGIAEGKIVQLGPNLIGTAREEIDATSLAIFPGVIDSHVHFNEPGRTEWEGFATGSRAAATGGTTTIFDMPLNSHPPTIDGPSFDAKRTAGEKESVVDFGLWGGLVPGNLIQLETLRHRGAVGLKAFMCNSGIDDFPHVDLATLREGMRIAAELNLLVAVHAESQEMTTNLTKEKLATGKASVRDFLETRPIEAELEAIRRGIDIAQETGCRLHIVHVSNGQGVAIVADARANGVDVTCETCPHYLLLTDRDMEELGAVAKCAPPLRTAEDQSELWTRIADISTIGSDHSPSPPAMKHRENFFQVWGGISGCQHLLALLCNSELWPERISALTSENVAQRFGIKTKGGIAIGKDADLSLVDLRQKDDVTAESLRYRHKQSPYLGRKLPRVVRTILRGQTIFSDGKLAPQFRANFVRPE
ncbi:MAG TPA: allantoinase AllB [Chthoniobacterales bacterium]